MRVLVLRVPNEGAHCKRRQKDGPKETTTIESRGPQAGKMEARQELGVRETKVLGWLVCRGPNVDQPARLASNCSRLLRVIHLQTMFLSVSSHSTPSGCQKSLHDSDLISRHEPEPKAGG